MTAFGYREMNVTVVSRDTFVICFFSSLFFSLPLPLYHFPHSFLFMISMNLPRGFPTAQTRV